MVGKNLNSNQIPKKILLEIKPNLIYETVVKENSKTASKVYLPENWKYKKVWVIRID